MLQYLLTKISQIKKSQKGTALLVALLVMGVLISVSLILSTLIVRELRLTTEALSAGRAYYAAESGIEESLFYLNRNLPGWSTDSEKRQLGDLAEFKYSVKNTCNAYPCLSEEEYDLSNMPTDKFYNVLEIGETATIPLFTVENGQIESVKDFTVEFFAGFDPQTDLNFANASDVAGWDVLRWKVFGMKNSSEGFVTESINDFTAVSSLLNKVTGEEFETTAALPTWFGTTGCSGKSGRLTDQITCNEYFGIAYSSKGEKCTPTQARDYYYYQDGEVVAVHGCYEIGTFMADHQAGINNATGLNYLTLTNMVNRSLFNTPDDEIQKKLGRIYYRVETYPSGSDSEKLVKEVAKITSDGFSGNAKQSIDVEIKKDSYMPVFNFSIYSTYKKP